MATAGSVPSRLGSLHSCSHGSERQIVQMGPGDGKDSYVKNSSLQWHVLQAVEKELWRGIRSASRHPETGHAGTALRVADLGCATGDNTVQYCVNKLLESLWESKSPDQAFPEDVEVFFTDLASNDFNTLFRSLPAGSSRRYFEFAAGVPGSFYGPLFPAGSIHAFTCFMALHWLSQIPPEVLDTKSPAFNSDRVHVRGPNPAVNQAFAGQSSRDLTTFLTHRARELAPGGFLALEMMAKLSDEQPHRTLLQDLFSDVFHDLVVQGLIPRDAVASFNIPMYFPSIPQVRRAVEDVGLFDIHLLQHCGQVCVFPPQKCEEYLADVRKFATDTAFFWKSLFRTSMEEHFGVEVSDLVFQHYERRVERLPVDGTYSHDYFTINYAVALLAKR